MTDILLRARGEGWISIENSSHGNGVKTAEYLKSVSKHFNRVCFGDERFANVGTYAIKIDRVFKFKEHATKHGLVADFASRSQ